MNIATYKHRRTVRPYLKTWTVSAVSKIIFAAASIEVKYCHVVPHYTSSKSLSPHSFSLIASASALTLRSFDKVFNNPRKRGIKLTKMIIDTTTAAVASASSGVTDSTKIATIDAIMTAVLRRVSANTCY